MCRRIAVVHWLDSYLGAINYSIYLLKRQDKARRCVPLLNKQLLKFRRKVYTELDFLCLPTLCRKVWRQREQTTKILCMTFTSRYPWRHTVYLKTIKAMIANSFPWSFFQKRKQFSISTIFKVVSKVSTK